MVVWVVHVGWKSIDINVVNKFRVKEKLLEKNRVWRWIWKETRKTFRIALFGTVWHCSSEPKIENGNKEKIVGQILCTYNVLKLIYWWALDLRVVTLIFRCGWNVKWWNRKDFALKSVWLKIGMFYVWQMMFWSFRNLKWMFGK